MTSFNIKFDQVNSKKYTIFNIFAEKFCLNFFENIIFTFPLFIFIFHIFLQFKSIIESKVQDANCRLICINSSAQHVGLRMSSPKVHFQRNFPFPFGINANKISGHS